MGKLDMVEQDWFVTNDGNWLPLKIVTPNDWMMTRPYRLYRFLTDVEDILAQVSDDQVRLQMLAPLVRRLLNQGEWLQTIFLPPDPETGWSVQMLYDEPDFPITIQMVTWAAGSTSPIHNHGTWGIVALLEGQEKNTLWRRSPTSTSPNKIVTVGEQTMAAGEILCLMPDTIHHIEVLGDQPCMSFNLYGETNYEQRFTFNLIDETAQIF